MSNKPVNAKSGFRTCSVCGDKIHLTAKGDFSAIHAHVEQHHPDHFSEDDLVREQATGRQYAWEFWQRDEERVAALKRSGYEVLIVWENDFMTDPNAVIQECVEFLT